MKILKSWLQDHIEDTLPSDEKITEILTMKSSEVEGVESVEVDGKKDTVFDIKVLPDRAHYMLSHRGIAYDICAVLGLKLKVQEIKIPEKGNDVSVKVESKNCNRYSAVLIKNINNIESPKWLKDRLEAIGARSINVIVDATNYAMFDTGQPLHAFDANKVVGSIVVRDAKDGEEIQLLPERVLVDGVWQEKERKITLTSSDMVIVDDVGPLAIAGVKGGLRAVVTNGTKNIILESASFNPVAVRKTSTKYGVRNDSSKRFENEITAHLVPKGSSAFLNLIEKLSPDCKVVSINDVYEKLPEKWNVSVDHKKIEEVLNYSISDTRVGEILNLLGCGVEVKNDTYEVQPPYERLDLVIEEDIIDEIGRIEGLDKIKSVLPKADTKHKFSSEFLLTEKIKSFFVGKGFSEVQTRSFAKKGDIEVAYPMAKDKGFLRTSLVEGVAESVGRAILNAPLLGLDKVSIFEIGKVFRKEGESLEVCFATDYAKKIKNKDAVIKSELESLEKEMKVYLGAGISLKTKIDKNIATLSDIVGNCEEMFPVSKASRSVFSQFSNEPFIVRDIALFVSTDVSVRDVEDLIKKSAQNVAGALLVKGPDLFDQFEKDSKKSLAFRMLFQAMDRTLSDDEVNGYMDKVYISVKEKGWEVR